MIRPETTMELDTCVLQLAATLLGDLRPAGSLTYTDAVDTVVKAHGDRARPNFLPAVSLLFLLGLVEYMDEEDEIALQFR